MSSGGTRWAAVACGLGVLLGTVAPAAEGVTPSGWGGLLLGDSVEVRLVTVEVRVQNDQGRPVAGLKASDFSLEVDGRPVAITHFAEVAVVEARQPGESAAGAAVATAPPVLPPSLIIYVDDLFLSPPGRRRAAEGIRALLKGDLPTGAKAMLVTFDRTGLLIRVPLTTDANRLLDALERLPLAATQGLQRDAERRSALDTIRMEQRWRYEAGRWKAEPPCARTMLDLVRAFVEDERRQARASAEALKVMVDVAGSLPGPRVLVHASDGIPLVAGLPALELLRTLCDGSGMREGVPYSIDVEGMRDLLDEGRVLRTSDLSLEWAQAAMTDSWREVGQLASARGVTLYPLQVSGLPSQSSRSASEGFREGTIEADAAARFTLQDPLTALAAETGGRAMLEVNDAAKALGGLRQDLTSGYSLGFTPPVGGRVGTHQIAVRVARRGASVRHRSSYRDEPANERIAHRLRTAILLGDAPNALQVGVEAVRVAGSGDVTAIRVRLPLEGLTLLPEGEVRRAFVAVHLLVRNEDGSLSPVRSTTLPIRLSAGPNAQRRPYIYEVRFREPLGKAVIAVAVEDLLAKTSAIARLDLQ